MARFFVHSIINAPYPIEGKGVYDASSAAIAASRAIKAHYKNILHKRRIISYQVPLIKKL